MDIIAIMTIGVGEQFDVEVFVSTKIDSVIHLVKFST